MRQIVLDTETTGLEVTLGHRIIEIAAVEIVNRRLTRRYFHRYINPDRDIDPGAVDVHGLTREFLQDKPRFADVSREFLDFVSGAELIIHNAAFDVGFLDFELNLLDHSPVSTHCKPITDTLRMARDLHPGKRNSLDALCERYEIDNSARTLHGALLDAELLAEVYLAMTRGQNALIIDMAPAWGSAQSAAVDLSTLELMVIVPTEAELRAHQAQVTAIDKAAKDGCLWRRLEVSAAPSALAASDLAPSSPVLVQSDLAA
ncbi:MAG TPA: DNA polymerase III subunit epsilon [Burkholderiales bacterium]|nr:DNA polymerase III subunit epsilon [Burkholderiales bacterium]